MKCTQLVVGLITLAWGISAMAQPATSSSRKPVTPSFALSGSTTGENTLSFGVDVLVPIRQDKDELQIKGAVETASRDGLSTLFDSSADARIGESSYGGVLSFKYVRFGVDPDAIEYLTLEERRDLTFLCMLDSTWNPVARDVALAPGAPPVRIRSVIHDRSSTSVDNLDYGYYCDSAKEKMNALQGERVVSLPRQQLVLGFSMGRDELEQLSPTESAMVFRSTNRARSRFGLTGGYAHFVPSYGVLIEVPVSIKRLSEPSTTKAQWCTPVGMLADEDGGMPALASCEERPLGDPTRMTKISAALRAGLVSKSRSWRISAGPTGKLGFGGDETTYELGFDVPFYFVRSAVDFTGVVRVAPALIWTRDAAGEKDRKVLLTVSLLGSRTLLETAFQ